MKNFIKIKAKKCIMPIVFLTLVAMAVYVLPILTCKVDENYLSDLSVYSTSLIVFLICAALFLPIWAAHYKMSARSLDVYYSLPISRRKLLLVNFVAGFLILLISYTVAYVAGAFITLVKFPAVAHIHYVWYYFALIIPAYIAYSISFFMYTRANSTTDGTVFILFSVAAVTALVSILYNLGANTLLDIISDGTTTFSPIIIVRGFFVALLYGREAAISLGTINSLVLFTLLSAAATFSLFYTEKYAKAENCGQISKSLFGYRVFIPFYAITFYVEAADWGISQIIWMYALIFIASYAMEALYSRTLKIGKKNLLVICGCLLAGIVCCIVKYNF